jgi:hypothetical protein
MKPMKKILVLVAFLLTVGKIHAAIVLSDSFNYPDGAIVGAAGSPWTGHSGSGSLLVTNSMIRVVNNSASFGEDVNAPLSGAPYDTTNNPSVTFLYSSFTMNQSVLPGVAGTYFAHFKDAGAGTAFRCRLYVLTSGTNIGGTFRLGIASTNSASTTAGFTALATDLNTNTNYKVVTRLNIATGNSTLWLNPTAESDPSVSSTADPGAGIAVPIAAYAFRQANNSGGVTLVDDLKVGTSFNDVAGANTSPTISTIANQNTPANVATNVSFTVGDAETAPGSLTVSGTSANQTLVPDANLLFGGSGANRTVTITPAAGQQGSTTISISVSDGVNTTSNQFLLTVGAPAISAISDQSTPVDTATAAIAFTISDTETAAGSLTVSAVSSNPGLVPSDSSGISFGGSGANRTITLTPAAAQAGLTTITVSVSDGINTTSTSFVLTVNPVVGLLLQDTFTYADGSVRTNSSFTWNTHSGGTGETQIASGELLLSQSQSEDISAFFTNGPSPVGTNSGFIIYTRFTANFTALPSGPGDYFAHLKNTGTSDFRAKIFSGTNNAAAGLFRIGIANSFNSVSAQFPTDLSLNTTYTVVTRYNVGTGVTTLWINPVTESSTGVTATDSVIPANIITYAFRQTGGIGAMEIDDLKIGSSFSDVVDPSSSPIPLNFQRIGNDLILTWSDSSFLLQAAPLVTGTYTNVTGATSPYTNSISGDQQFFRLKQ